MRIVFGGGWNLSAEIERLICQSCGVERCELGEVIQRLWSGYGVIQKVDLIGDIITPAVVKHVDLSKHRSNRRGWDGDVSHQRKVKSYEVENEFYRNFSGRCSSMARVPKLLGATQLSEGQGWVIVVEDLDSAGFAERKSRVDMTDVKNCLRLIANFHGEFMTDRGEGLWEAGTYWHLATRPDELAAMNEGLLKQAAKAIDERLSACKFQTLVHGDAKLANFCFADDKGKLPAVSAVDFQYVGRGCGMKDVVYFLTSCLDDRRCEQEYEQLLGFYFENLAEALGRDFERMADLENEWRSMFAMAWADFNRFLNGWSPGHWKLTPFSQRMTDEALRRL